MKILHKKYHKKVNLNRIAGHRFLMAFVYLPEGPLVLTGCDSTIFDYLKDKPTCHGEVCFGMDPFMKRAYREKNEPIPRRVEFHSWELFGCRCDDLALNKNDKKWELSTRSIVRGCPFYKKIGSWRRLPRSYMRQLGEFESGSLTD